MKRLNAVMVGTLGLMAALSVAAMAQDEAAKAEFKDKTVIEADEVLQLEDGTGEDADKLVISDAKKIKVFQNSDPCGDNDYDSGWIEKDMDYNPDTETIGKKGKVAGAKCEIKVKLKKAKAAAAGRGGKKCLKESFIVIKKKEAATAEEWAAIKTKLKQDFEVKFKKSEAKIDAEKAKFMLVVKKKVAAQKESKMKIDSKGNVQSKNDAATPAAAPHAHH